MELTKDYIIGAINARNDAAENALLGLYARQTTDEQQSQHTSHQNGMGFNGTDADILSSFAEQVEKKRDRGYTAGSCLSEKQLALLRKKLPKYSRQLLEIAQEKAALRAETARLPVLGEVRAPAPVTASKLNSPTGYVQEGNGWRMKTARDFCNEGVRLKLDLPQRVKEVMPIEPLSEFEACFVAL